jgi:4-hydroxy-2-oxoheptanedioate aldolase
MTVVPARWRPVDTHRPESAATVPMRSELRVGPVPEAADEAVACDAMIETASALANVEEICAVNGLDGVYVGPSDLTLALGGRTSTDPAVATEFTAALERITVAAAAAGIAAGVHCPDGTTAARRLAAGFTFATVSSDLRHLEAAARDHLRAASSES